jgi:hypothetical protein
MRTRIISGLLVVMLAVGVMGMPGSLALNIPGNGDDQLVNWEELIETTYTTLPPDITNTIVGMAEGHCVMGNKILASQGYTGPTTVKNHFEYDPLEGPCGDVGAPEPRHLLHHFPAVQRSTAYHVFSHPRSSTLPVRTTINTHVPI